MRVRSGISLLIGVTICLLSFRFSTSPLASNDFSNRSIWPARALLAGANPYAGTFTVLDVPYPLPAMLLGLPFVGFDVVTGAAVFNGITAALLAFALIGGGYWRLILLLSFPFFQSVLFSQYVSFVALALLLSEHFALPLMLIKPQSALAGLVMRRPSKWAIIVTSLILIVSLLINWRWPIEWLQSVRAYDPQMIPLLAPFGFLLVLALIRWREPHYRALFVMSLSPHRGMYDHLLVGILARD